MAGIPYSQLGVALGIGKSMVAKLVKQGMPVHSVEAAQAWRQASLDVSRTKTARVGSVSGYAMAQAPDAGQDDDEPLATDDAAYKKARTEREQIRRDRELLQLEQERGKLVDKTEVARLRFTEFRALRDGLSHIGARTKDALSVETDPLKCEQIVVAELERVLATFADQILTRGVMQDLDDDADDEGEGASAD